ncbi:ABC transporter ATP-binding protein/permease [Candidatus Pelagibacter sp.]|nr:ABC transporter ATP-binding protein/permease [Candidatus Pelagibacter sp.]
MNFHTLALLKQLGLKKFIFITILSVLASIFEIFGIGSIGPFINIINSPDYISENNFLNYFVLNFNLETEDLLLYFGLVIIIIFIFVNFYKAWLFYLQTKISLNFSASMSVSLFKKYLNNDYYFFLIRNSNELAKNIFGECQLIGNDVIKNSLVILSQLIIALFIISFCIFLNPRLGMIMIFLGASYYFLIYILLKKWLKRFGENQLLHATNRWKIISESLQSVKEIKIFGFFKYLDNFFSTETSKWTNNKILYTMVGALPRYLIEIIGVVFLISLTLYLVYYQQQDNVFSFIAVYSFALLRLFPVFQQIYMALAGLKSAQSRIKLIYNDFNQKKYLREKKLDSKNQSLINESIKLEELNFKYEKGDFALNKISLNIKSGQILGITGYSGSGKSTLVDILLGLLKVESGKLYIDGKAINIEDYIKYKDNFSYVPQDIFIFAESLKNNITFDFENKSIDKVLLKKSISGAQLDEFILNQQDNLETLIHDKGLDISGGQKQRIGIARALYLNKKITILDEATNSLDSDTEIKILEHIKKNKKDKIFIIVSHKKSTLKYCDNIIFLNKGKIDSEESYDEFIKSNKDLNKNLT